MASSSDVRSTYKGVVDSKFDGKVTQYRGIQYAKIKKRFEKPVLNTKWQKSTDFTTFGPRCPQVRHDFRTSLHIPKDLLQWPEEQEDELKCANLTITCPSDTSLQKLPVIVWVYGGSQMQTFGSSAQIIAGPNPFVAQSIDMDKPVVFVSVHYRLNIFGFGSTEGEVNLDLQDQRMAIKWVKKYISQFGGDPENITLAGESAGGIYIHALLASGTEVARAILHSGCLFTNPPQPDKRGFGLLGLIEGNLQLMEVEKGNMNPGASAEATISGASVDSLVTTLKDLQITSKWMWDEPSFKDWQDLNKSFGKLKGLMLGDCEAEGVIYARLINSLNGAGILKAFESASSGTGRKIAEAYSIPSVDDAASREAAIQFIGDARFAWPNQDITQRLRASGTKVHRFVFDQVNPFAKKNPKAQHCIDVVALFAGYEDAVGKEMKAVGETLRSNWIAFANGEQPWNAEKVFAYGPNGKSGEINDEEVATRRRVRQFEVLKEAGLKTYQEIWLALLSAGALALEN